MKIALFIFLLFPLIYQAQIKNWYGSDLSRLGVKFNTVKFKNFDNSVLQFKGRSSDFETDLITKHVYFGLDGTFLSDIVLVGVLGLNKKEETWFKKNDIGRFDRVKILPIRLGFGLPITQYGALYAGGQWQYAQYGLTPPRNSKTIKATELKGHQFGLGIHGFASLGPVMIKQSFMKDWFSTGKKRDGGVNVFETTVYAGYSILGMYLRYARENFREVNNPVDNQKFTITTISVGIYASGLFSGVNKGTAKAVYETETGLRRERNWKKRNTIEYKE